jgi:hypothetical protein
MWLGWLTPLRWFTVIGTTVLSALAGATILGAPRLIGSSFPTFAGLCALGASILSVLHTALHCDAHQAECRRLINSYTALEAAFQALQTFPQAELKARANELEKIYEDTLKAAMASPPVLLRKRATKERIEMARD